MPSLRPPAINFAPQVADLLPAVSTPIPGIADVTGPMLLGHLFNWGLFGAIAMQVYVYTGAFYKHDRKLLQATVYFIFILDILQTALATHYAWWVLASGWGNPWTLRFTPWTLGLVPVLTGVIALIVQLFFAWRIYVLGITKIWWPVLGFIIITAFGQCAAAMYSGIISDINLDVATRQNLEPPVTIWLALSCACDIAITVTLVTQLRMRRGQGFGTYNGVLDKYVRLSIETGAITAIVVVVELITFLQRDSASWYYFFGMCIGKLYSNTLVATLNSRGSFKLRDSTEQTSTLQDSGTSVGKVFKASGSSNRTEVVTHRTQTVKSELDDPGEWSAANNNVGNAEDGNES